MKKAKYLIIFAMIGLVSNSFAQSNATASNTNAQFGLKAGLNYSNVYDSKGEQFNSDPKFGLAAGAFLSLPINQFIGIQPEFLLSQKGFQATGVILGGTYDFTRTTTFIDVPILFQLKPSYMITLLAGPQFSYLVKQKDVFKNGSTTIAQEEEFENDNIRRNILGFVGGADLNFDHTVLGIRVAWDLTANNGDGTSTTPRYKNVLYQLTLGYKLY